MSESRNWQLNGPLDLRQTLRFVLPSPGPSVRFEQERARFAVWTAAGAVAVDLAVVGDSLNVAAFGPGAKAVLDELPRLVGLDDDPNRFAPGTGPLRRLHLANLGFRLGSGGRVYDTLLPAILGQRVTTDEANRSYRTLAQALGQPAPGGFGLVMPPLPEAIAGLSYEHLHRHGIERGRAEILIEAARRSSRLEEILDMGPDQARRRLQALRGIGPWTAAQVMGAAWGDRDAVPIGDFHLPNTVAWFLAREPRATDDRMVELLEPFRPLRRRAMILIKLSGVHAPRYGPRSAQSSIGNSAW